MAEAIITTPNIGFTLGNSIPLTFSNPDNYYLKVILQRLDSIYIDVETFTLGQVTSATLTPSGASETIFYRQLWSLLSGGYRLVVASYPNSAYSAQVGVNQDKTGAVYIDQVTNKPVFTNAVISAVDKVFAVVDKYANTLITSNTNTLTGGSNKFIKGFNTIRSVIAYADLAVPQNYARVGYYRFAAGLINKSKSQAGNIAGDAALDTIASTQHNLQTGDAFYLYDAGSNAPTPPAPLTLNTKYYAIRINSTTLKVATSYANAIANTAINLTTDGGVNAGFVHGEVTLDIENAVVNSFDTSVVDGRVLSTTITQALANMADYFVLGGGSVVMTRDNNVDAATKLAFTGLMWKGFFGGGATGVENAIIAEYRFKESSDAWGAQTWDTIVPSVDGSGNITFDDYIDGDLGAAGFDTSKSYSIEVRMYDKLSQVIIEGTLAKGIPLFDYTSDKAAVMQKVDAGDPAVWQVAGEISRNGVALQDDIDDAQAAAEATALNLVVKERFGNGIDGDIVFSANTDITSEKHYHNVTINAGITVGLRGYPLFVSGKLTIGAGGKLHDDGDAGTNGSTGGSAIADTAPNHVSVHPLIPAPAGGVGTDGSGVNGTSNGAGGAGGTPHIPKDVAPTLQAGCGGGSGGNHGNAPSVGKTGLKSLGGASGGAGGAATGGGNSWGHGGNGGTGGGVVLLHAYEIDNAGTISANGGAGGNGATPTSATCGAGGGGGGGTVYIVYRVASGSGLGTTQANGGVHGTGNGGSDGSAGVVFTKQI